MENQKRTYKEAVEIMANWWINKTFETKFNQDNGSSDCFLILANIFSNNIQDEVTEEQIKKFKTTMIEELMLIDNINRHTTELSVDYDPSRILRKACQVTNISSFCLPIKTFTFIEKDNSIHGRYQMGDWFEL